MSQENKIVVSFSIRREGFWEWINNSGWENKVPSVLSNLEIKEAETKLLRIIAEELYKIEKAKRSQP